MTRTVAVLSPFPTYFSWGEPATIRELILSGKIRERVRSLPPLEIPQDEPIPYGYHLSFLSHTSLMRRVHSMMALIMHAYLVGNALENEPLLHEVGFILSSSH